MKMYCRIALLTAVTACSTRCYAGPTSQQQSLLSLAAAANARYIPTGDGAAVETAVGRLLFAPASRKMTFDGLLIWLNAPVRVANEDLLLDRIDVESTVLPLLRPGQVLADKRVKSVVIDPGHGGQAFGARGSGMMPEKDIVLDIARRVRRKLQLSDVRARLTRDGDQTLSLSARPERAARWGADVFVSIHVNSAANPAAAGVETYVLPAPGYPSTSGSNANGPCPGNKHDPLSLLLAYHVHRGMFASARSQDRGIRRARFEVLRNAQCAAVLVECGFLSNPQDALNLENTAHRNALAEGIARGLLTYISACNRP